MCVAVAPASQGEGRYLVVSINDGGKVRLVGGSPYIKGTFPRLSPYYMCSVHI